MVRQIIPTSLLCLSILTTFIWLILFHNQISLKNNNFVSDRESSSLQQLLHRHTQANTNATASDHPSSLPLPHIWKYVNNTQWCHSCPETSSQASSNSPGLIYMKIPKAASSTLVGINIRIARKVGARTLVLPSPGTTSSQLFYNFFDSSWFTGGSSNRNNNNMICDHSKYHGRQHLLERSEKSNPNHNLIWTFLRLPQERAISSFYHFEVSRKGKLPTNMKLHQYLQTQKNYEFKYIADHPDPDELINTLTRSENPNDIRHQQQQVVAMVQDYVLNPYDFIGLVERMDESLAVMKLLWSNFVRDEDLIVLKAKQSGKYDDGRSNNGTCIKIQKPASSFNKKIPYYVTDDFQNQNYDYLLYDIVNKSLDYTIGYVLGGRDVVNRQVQRLRYLQRYAEDCCQQTAIFPCSSIGTNQRYESQHDCYLFDSGCGYRCVDDALFQFNNLTRQSHL